MLFIQFRTTHAQSQSTSGKKLPKTPNFIDDNEGGGGGRMGCFIQISSGARQSALFITGYKMERRGYLNGGKGILMMVTYRPKCLNCQAK